MKECSARGQEEVGIKFRRGERRNMVWVEKEGRKICTGEGRLEKCGRGYQKPEDETGNREGIFFSFSWVLVCIVCLWILCRC